MSAFLDAETLAAVSAKELTKHIRTAVASRRVCRCVFPGGRSPRRVLELLCKQDLPWQALHLYPNDEHCVPVGDPEHNEQLINDLPVVRVQPTSWHLDAAAVFRLRATDFARQFIV